MHIQKTLNYYQYIIGYIHNNLLNFLNYKYYFSSHTNSLVNSQKEKMHKRYNKYDEYINSYYIENKGLSCQYMIDVYGDKIFVCFFMVIISSNYFITYDYFLILDS